MIKRRTICAAFSRENAREKTKNLLDRTAYKCYNLMRGAQVP